MSNEHIAIVKEINIYPVKSMAGHMVNEAMLDWHGFDGDRKFAFVKDGDLSHFPWLTARHIPEMLHYAPYFVDPSQPATSAIRVRTPDGVDLPLESAELIERLVAHNAGKYAAPHLLHLAGGTFDEFPVSLISSATLAGLSAQVGFAVTSSRFRPNIVVEPVESNQADGIEDRWVGHTLCIGADSNRPQFAVSLRDPRCVMVNYDRQTLKQTPELLREIAQFRGSCTGVYGSTLRPGVVRVGDIVYLE
jgi:hypothetical protein